MGENKVDQDFEQAFKTDDLENFLLGKGKYFILDSEVGEHWPLGSYQKFIEPYLDQHDHFFEKEFWFRLIQIINSANDKNLLIDLIVAYLIPYYNNQVKGIAEARTENTPQEFINTIREFISKNNSSLRKDYRGSGVEWNSKNGLLGGITTNLKTILKRGGPNFLPNDFL